MLPVRKRATQRNNNVTYALPILSSFLIGCLFGLNFLATYYFPEVQIKYERATAPQNDIVDNSFWCPAANCEGTGICKPCKNKFLFVLATGRSGSTTTLAMLNKLPNVRIAGENNDVMYSYNSLVRNLTSYPNFKVGPNVKDGSWWHEDVLESTFACPAQEFLRTINPPSLSNQRRGIDEDFIIGFKEIRWFRHMEFENDYKKLVETYTKLFPCSRFVISIRSNTQDQAKSAFFGNNAQSEEETIKYLEHLNMLHVQLHKYLGEQRAFLLDINEWSQPGGSTKFDELAHWMGFKNCKFPDEIGNCWNYVTRKHMSKTNLCKEQSASFSLGDNCAFNP